MHVCGFVNTFAVRHDLDSYVYMMQGCHTPPPPPSPWYPPLPVKWVVVLFGLVAFPVWSCLASSPPPPVEWDLWSFWLAPPRLWGAVCSTEVWYGCCHLLVAMSSLRALSPPPPVGWGLWSFWLAPPRLWWAVCSTEVWYGCCHLLVAMSSLRALSPPPPVGWGLWSFWLAPPRLCGAVCSTEIWYGCCHLLVVMSSLRARYHTKYDVALFSLQTVRPVPALMRFSAPVKKHWLGSFSIVLPRSGLRGFVPVVRDRREQGPPAAGGRGQGRGGRGVGARDPRAYMRKIAIREVAPIRALRKQRSR